MSEQTTKKKYLDLTGLRALWESIQSKFEPKFDTLPIEKGGLGTNSFEDALKKLGAVPIERTINDKNLGENIKLNAVDVGAITGKEVDDKITTALGGVSADTLQTLQEISAALGHDPDTIGALFDTIESVQGNIESVQAIANEAKAATETLENSKVNKSGDTMRSLTLNQPLSIASGGTGASDAATARTNLGITPGNIGALPTHPASIEMIPGTSANHGGFIDFHFNGDTGDHSSRIIEDESGILNLNYGRGVKLGSIYTAPVLLNDSVNSIVFSTVTNTIQYALIQSIPQTSQLMFVQKNGGGSIWANNEHFYLPAPDLSRTGQYGYEILTTKSAVTIAQGGTGATNAKTARANLEITPGNIGAVPNTLTINNKALTSHITLTASDVNAVPTSRTINSKPLSANISLTAADVNAVPTSRTINNKPLSANISLAAADVGALSINGGTVNGTLKVKYTDGKEYEVYHSGNVKDAEGATF